MKAAQKLEKILRENLDNLEINLLDLLSFENRKLTGGKEAVVVRMPVGVIILEPLFEKIQKFARENNIEIIKADTYGTLEELDTILADVKWLWDKWIPKGFVTLLAADPGKGKTTLAIDLIRIVTNGDAFPLETEKTKSANAVWVDAEAGQQILRERALSLKVNRSKVFMPVIDGDILAQPDILNVAHKEHIVNLVTAKKPSILVLDSLGGINKRGENKIEEVRPIMEFFASLSRDYELALLLIHHLNKSPRESVEVELNRVRGSTAITAFCRSVLVLETGTKEDELKLSVIKSNLAKISKPLSVTFISKDDKIISVNYDYYTPPPPKQTQKEKCADWLLELLSHNQEPFPFTEILSLGEPQGFSRATVYSAKSYLGDRITVGGTGKKALWSLTVLPDLESEEKIIRNKNGK